MRRDCDGSAHSAEARYMDLGSFDKTLSLVTPPIGATIHSRIQDHIFRAGINYHFSAGGPVVARY